MFYEIDIEYDNTLCYNNVLLSGIYFTKKIENTCTETRVKMQTRVKKTL